MHRLDHHDPPDGAAAPTVGDSSSDAVSGAEGAFPAPPSTLTVDWRLYEHHLAEADLTDQEKREFIEALWYIIVSFVDLGFGIEPVQHAMKAAAMDDLKPAVPVLEAGKDSSLARQDDTRHDATDRNNKENKQKGSQA